MRDWYTAGWRLPSHAGESAVRTPSELSTSVSTIFSQSWLIDTGRDDDGLQVLVDLHGGDPDDLKAKVEYNEIRDLVIAEASPSHALRLVC